MKKVFTLFISVLISFSLIAQKDSNDCCVNGSYVKSYFTDAYKLVKSPLGWNKKQALTGAAVLGVTGLSFAIDKDVSDFFERNQNDFATDLNTYFFDPYGKMYYTIPVMGGLYIYGAIAKKNKEKAVAMDLVKASFYSGVLALGVKHLAHRARPYQNNPKDPFDFGGPAGKFGHTSFFSGHTVEAFTFAGVLANHYSDKKFLVYSVYSLAVLEGVSRIYIQKHYPSDVILGAAVGIAVSRFVVKNNFCNFSVNPVLSSNYSALHFTYIID